MAAPDQPSGDPPDDPPDPDPPARATTGPAAIAAAAASRGSTPPAPRRSGSIDIPMSDPQLTPVREPLAPNDSGPIKRRASTASVINEHVVAPVVAAAGRVVHTAEALGGKVGDVVGESLSHLPVMPKTRRGRVLARSILVSFCLVFSWIAVIVGLQLRERRPPDLRPEAEAVLIALRDGNLADVYEQSSTRFQEVVLREKFEKEMEDLNRTLGRFQELTAVVATVVNRGPSGRTGRVDLRLEFERIPTKGTLSFRWEDDRWKLLGLSIDVPDELMKEAGTAEARRDRVRGNEIELRALATNILTQSSTGHVDDIWNQAAPSFQQAIPLVSFQRTEADRLRTLGSFQRILSVQSARINPNLTGSSLDCVIEFANATIKGSFQFTRSGGAWLLTYYKLVLPLPRIPS